MEDEFVLPYGGEFPYLNLNTVIPFLNYFCMNLRKIKIGGLIFKESLEY